MTTQQASSQLASPQTLKIKRLHPDAKLPTRMTAGAAGYDITATSVKLEDSLLVYGTALAFEIPEGYVGLLFQRSSVSKTTLQLSNAVGVIDSDFRDEVTFKFRYVYSGQERIYKVGERVGQLVLLKLPEVDIVEVSELSDTQRVGGYGSTGR